MRWTACALFALAVLAPRPAAAATVTPLKAPDMPIGGAAFLMGEVYELRATLAPALYHDGGTVIAVTDRGPVAPCAAPEALTGADAEALCGGSEDGTVFADSDYAPLIHQLTLEGDTLTLDYALPLKGEDEVLLSGRPPLFTDAEPEPAYTAFGEAAPFDAGGVDPAGIVRLHNHSYLVAESYGPSLMAVQIDGTIITRHVPKGRGEAFAEAPYPVAETLDKDLAGARAAGLALHEGVAYLATEGPKGTIITAFEDGKVARTIAYKPGKGAHVAGIAATAGGALVVLERTDKAWSLHRADVGGKTAKKDTIVTSAQADKAPARVAGFAILDDRTLLLAEDDDYGLGGAEPGRFVRLKLDKAL